MMDCSWLDQLGLGLVLWKGTFEGWDDQWLRWCDPDRNLLSTGEEQRTRAEEAKGRTQKASQRAQGAEDLAREAQAHPERIQERLRELGLEPQGP